MFKSIAMMGASVLGLAALPAVAADAAHPEASFRIIVNQGYQVVATESLNGDDAQKAGLKNIPSTIVTLQKGTSVAVCAFSTQNWYYMADADLEAATSCDYRDYSSATAAAAAPAAEAPATQTPAPASTDNATPADQTPATQTPAAPAPAAPAASDTQNAAPASSGATGGDGATSGAGATGGAQTGASGHSSSE